MKHVNSSLHHLYTNVCIYATPARTLIEQQKTVPYT